VRVYTRAGDKGETRLGDGRRVRKDHPRVVALGAVDELMAALAVARSASTVPWVAEALTDLLPQLSIVCAELALATRRRAELRIGEEQTRQLESLIDRAQEVLPPLSGFQALGETMAESTLHFARTVARRAERAVVHLADTEEVSGRLLAYLNRLSDLLYMLALVEGHEHLVREVKRRVVERMSSNARGGPGCLSPDFQLTLADARRWGEAARRKAGELGVAVVVAVVDAGGHLLLLERMEGALLVSIDLAVKKAYTAVALRTDTASLGANARPGSALYGIQHTDPRLVVFGGGIPLFAGERLVGGVGVSGGTVEQDVACAEAGIAALQTRSA